jgi:hypothetical protein
MIGWPMPGDSNFDSDMVRGKAMLEWPAPFDLGPAQVPENPVALNSHEKNISYCIYRSHRKSHMPREHKLFFPFSFQTCPHEA